MKISPSGANQIEYKEVRSDVLAEEKVSVKADTSYCVEEDVVLNSDDSYSMLPMAETRLVLDEIDNTTWKNKKMLKKLCCDVKDLKKGQKCMMKDHKKFEHKALTGIDYLKLKEEEESKMMYSNCVEAVPTVAVMGNGGCNGCHNQQPIVMPTSGGGGLFGNDGMGGGLLGGLLFGALLGGRGGLFGGNGAWGGGGFDGFGSGNTATVAATDFGMANLLSNLNGTIATEIGSLGVATANQTQLLSKEIGTTTDTLLQGINSASTQTQDKIVNGNMAIMGGLSGLASDICGVNTNILNSAAGINTNILSSAAGTNANIFNAAAGLASDICNVNSNVLAESCANQRVTEAVGANMINAINGNTMAVKDQANSNFIAGMQQSANQFMALKDCCCETQRQIADCCCETNQNIAQGNFALSNQMCQGFNSTQRDIWSTTSAIEAQNCANTAAIQAQACANTAALEKTMFQNAIGAERQLNAVAREQAECCCEQKLLTTMGFANIQNSIKDGFCDLKSDLARDKIEELRIANANNRDALNQKALADAINITLTNGFTQLGAVFTSNVIPAIQAAVKTA